MSDKFPHLNTTGAFPPNNVNVFQYDNQFDYSRFDDLQMTIELMSVPWDMGEAHIGNRTIGGIGNVVYFGSEQARDTWLDQREKLTFETKYKNLHTDNKIIVPVPFDVACNYNYLRVKYNAFANDGSPVEYETAGGLRQWLWFIRDVEMLAPNATKLNLIIDAWQTFIYRVDISSMILERGHAPMIDADVYLSNPVANCGNLLCDDVSFGNATLCKHTDEFIYNSGDMYAVVITSANPKGNYGTKAGNNWKTPSGYKNQDGVPNYYAFAVDSGDFSTFITAANSTMPQFLQTIKGVCFVAKALVNTAGDSFELCGVQCTYLSNGYKANNLYTFEKSDFGYNYRYAELAKLYTYPYAYLAIMDSDGNETQIRIEDTTGTITLETCANLCFPWLAIDSHLLGIGKAANRSISFKTLSNKTIPIGGNWYETLTTLKIPVFGVQQSGNTHNDYSTHYDRIQANTALTNAYDSAVASANTAKSNADASADTDHTNSYTNANTNKSNADASADTEKTNADASADTAKTNTTASNTAITNNAANDNTMQTNVTNNNNALNQTLEDNQAARMLVDVAQSAYNTARAASNNLENAGVSIAAGGVNAALGGVGGGLQSNLLGAVGFIASSAATMAVTANNTTFANEITEYQISTYQPNMETLLVSDNTAQRSNATANTLQVNTNRTNNTTNTVTASNDNATRTQTTTKANATRTQAVTKANATRTQTAAKDNADRTQTTTKANATATKNTAIANAGRTKSTAQDAITNSIAQRAMDAPFEFGAYENGQHSTTRPMGMYASIVTQNDYAIQAAGDEFLRYGYRLDRNWQFNGDWLAGKSKFCYWKLRDFWIRGLNVPDAYVDRLRFFLFEGVTVWRLPEFIGYTSIYDNE